MTPRVPGDAGDALSGLAPLLRVRPELEDLCRFGGDWRSAHDEVRRGRAYFHIVTQGQCVLERSHRALLTLKAGDVLLLPHGDQHAVRTPSAAHAGSPPVRITYNKIVAMARAGDALSMRHDSGESAETAVEGYDIKLGQIEDALQKISLTGGRSLRLRR